MVYHTIWWIKPLRLAYHTRTMEDMYIGDGTDMVHDHLSLGIRPGCVACAQLEADFACAQQASRGTLAGSAAGAGARTERDN